jgi:hypothetical protein
MPASKVKREDHDKRQLLLAGLSRKERLQKPKIPGDLWPYKKLDGL